MIKIQMYSVRPDEQTAIKQWLTTHKAEIKTTSQPLTPTTMSLAIGCQAVVVAQHGALESEVYQFLASQKIQVLSLRITGYDIIDFDQTNALNIRVTNVPAYSPRSVAEETLTHTMVLLRHLRETQLRMQKHDFSWGGLEASEIHNLTVGILGAGKIGGTVARIFKALGARVIANDLIKRPELADTLDYVSFDELLTQSDILTIHTNLTPATTHIINAAALTKMKATAILINCARGPIIDLPAILTALDQHQLGALGLDTVEGETGVFGDNLQQSNVNLSLYDQLLARPNVSLSPHIGFYTDQAVQNMVETGLNDAWLLVHGQASPHLVKGND